MNRSSIIGCILGTAIGDSIGIPYEGLTKQRAARMLGPPDRHRFFFGRGMISDDTEHTCLVAQSLLSARGDLKTFQRSLAWRLRFWLASLPAGIGLATLRAILRLWCGISPDRSGVFSAGNGPAMRAAILGVAIPDATALQDFVRVSTRLTHTDPKAEAGALLVAHVARLAADHGTLTTQRLRDLLSTTFNDASCELNGLLTRAVDSVERNESTEAFAESLGLRRGVSGYTLHTVPVAIHVCLAHPRDIRTAVMTAIRCGGDTDSVAAIVGGIVGAAVGPVGLPDDWLRKIAEWPRSVAWMERLGEQLAASSERESSILRNTVFACGVVLRNLAFASIVLFHGFRRLAPPY